MWVEQRKSQFFHWKENLIRLNWKISQDERNQNLSQMLLIGPIELDGKLDFIVLRSNLILIFGEF